MWLVVFASLAGLISLYYLGTSFYFIIFHPLSEFPGPFTCAFSRIPYWVVSIRGVDVPWMKTLHDRYGPIVRFGPTDLSYASGLEAWKDIHGPKVTEKAQEFSVQPVNGVPSMLTANTENHARVRKLFSPAFSDRALKKQEPLFRRYAALLVYKISEVGENGSRPIDLARLFNFATFDVMAELCFGENLQLLANNEFSPWVRSIFELTTMLPFAAIINYYPFLNAIFTRFEPKSVVEARVRHCKHSADRVDKRLLNGSSKPDIWNLVIEAQESGNGLSLHEMHSNSELFMLAGSETTATLLSGLIFYLLNDNDRMRALTHEIRTACSGQKEVTFESLASLKYLNACIKEALRIYPPVPIGSPRVIQPGAHVVLGRRIPAETRVSVHHWATYHSENNFKDADQFVPERWLGTEYRYAGDALEAHQPFGFGPRNCLGQNMAMHEMRLFLASVLLAFDFKLSPESTGWTEQKAFALWSKGPLMVRAVAVPKAEADMQSIQ